MASQQHDESHLKVQSSTDAIVEINKSSPPHHQYFAIGAMLNPVSMKNRDIHPLSSEPAELLDYRLGFFTSMGFAEAISEPGSSFHGVIHVVSSADMTRLDIIEQEYVRQTATARLYNGEERQVTVYTRRRAEYTDPSPPAERYLEIMVAGCMHHGVDESHIEFLRNHDKTPRPEPTLSFRPPPPDRSMSLDQVFENDGSNGKPFYISMNGKVISMDFERDSDDWIEFRDFFLHSSQVGELAIARTSYDPLYGVPERVGDFTPEHAAYCEHNLCLYLQVRGSLDQWRTIASLKL